MIPLNENPEPKSFSEKFKETASRMSGAFGGFEKMFGEKTKNERISEENRPLFTTLAPGDISPTKKGESISNITAKIYNLLTKENKENKKEYKKKNRLLKKEEKLKEKRHKQVVRALLGRQAYKVLGRIPKIKFFFLFFGCMFHRKKVKNGFFVLENISCVFFSELFYVPENIQIIIHNLKSNTNVFAKIVKMFCIFFFGTSN
jgi:hypothetical protein